MHWLVAKIPLFSIKKILYPIWSSLKWVNDVDSWRRPSRRQEGSCLCNTTSFIKYSIHTQNNWRLGQGHGLQNTILTSYFSKNIYQKMIYVYFHKSIFQDKSIHIIFIFSNSTTWELFMIYILKIWLKPCPKHQLF